MAVFPTSVPTDADLYIAINTGVTALTAGIDNVTLTIPASTTGFPPVGFITIDSEIIKYTSLTPTQFNASLRGADGTAANSHLNGAQVNHFIIAAHHNAPKDEIIAIAQNLSDRIGLGATQLKTPDGSAAAPSHSFASETGLGWYRAGAGRVGLAFGTVEAAFFDGTTGVFSLKNNYNMHTNVGTAALPGYAFNGDADTGIYNVSADVLGFSTGGVQRAQINSLGYLGIGAAPSFALHITRAVNDTTNRININNANTTAAQERRSIITAAGDNNVNEVSLIGGKDSTGLVYEMVSGGSNYLQLGVGGVEHARLTTAGFYFGNGTVALPSISFLSDTDTGLYRSASDQFRLVAGANIVATAQFDGSVTQMIFGSGSLAAPAICIAGNATHGFYRVPGLDITGTSVPIGFQAGTATNPSMTFAGDENTGIYQVTTDTLGFAAGGTQAMRMNAGNILISRDFLPNADASYQIGGSGSGFTRLFMNDGTVSAPSITLSGDTDTGLYRSSVNQISVALGGAQHILFDKTAFNVYCANDGSAVLRLQIAQEGLNLSNSAKIYNTDGSAAAPAYSFGLDTDTGFFRQGSGEVRYSDNGSTRMQWGTDIRSHVNFIPAVDNAVSLGANGQRWTAVHAVNGTIQTSHSSTKQNILDIDPLAVEIPRGVEFDRDGRRFLGYLNDVIPNTGRPFNENGEVCLTDNYEQSVIGILCAHVRKLENDLSALKAEIQDN